MTIDSGEPTPVKLGSWKCLAGCRGSTFFTVGWKNGQQISEMNSCGMCGTFEGWRVDDAGSKIYLREVSHEDNVPE